MANAGRGNRCSSPRRDRGSISPTSNAAISGRSRSAVWRVMPSAMWRTRIQHVMTDTLIARPVISGNLQGDHWYTNITPTLVITWNADRGCESRHALRRHRSDQQYAADERGGRQSSLARARCAGRVVCARARGGQRGQSARGARRAVPDQSVPHTVRDSARWLARLLEQRIHRGHVRHL